MSNKEKVKFFKIENNDFVKFSDFIKEIFPDGDGGYIFEITKNWKNIVQSEFISDIQQKLITEKTKPIYLKQEKSCYTLFVSCKQSEIKSIITNNKNRIINNINTMFGKVVVKNIKFGRC